MNLELNGADINAAVTAIEYTRLAHASGTAKANVTRRISTASIVSGKLSRRCAGLSRREMEALLFCLRFAHKDLSRLCASDDLADDLLAEFRDNLAAWSNFLAKLEASLNVSAGDLSVPSGV